MKRKTMRYFGVTVGALLGLATVPAMIVPVTAARAEQPDAAVLRTVEDAEKEIRAMYDDFARALDNGDSDAVAKFLAPGYEVRRPLGGTGTRSEVLNAVGDLKNSGLRAKTEIKVWSIEAKGDRATAVGRLRIELTSKDQPEMKPLVLEIISRDSLAKTEKGWQINGIYEVANYVTSEGKVVALNESEESRQLREEITKVQQVISTAYEAGDGKTVGNHITADFQRVNINGDITSRDDFVAINPGGSQRLPFDLLQASKTRDGALSLRKQRIITTVVRDGEQRQLTATRFLRDTWKKTDGGWKLQKIEVLAVEQAVEGENPNLTVAPEKPAGN